MARSLWAASASLVSDLALQAGLVLRNVRLVEDLRACLEAVGGSLEIRSAPGAGTSVIGRIPVGEEAHP